MCQVNKHFLGARARPSQTGDTGKLTSSVCAHVHMCAGIWVCMSVHA